MKNTPLVTILMPAYNHEKFIESSLESLISQTYNNIELIIFDDGSKDNTNEKILSLKEKCIKRFIKFKYIHRDNKGLLNTLKEMEEYITGEYIVMFASDDISLPRRIEKQVDVLEKNDEMALCYTSLKYMDDDSKILNKKHKIKNCRSGYVFEKLLERNFIPAPTVMMRTSIFKSLGGYSTDFAFEDYPLWLKITKKHKVIFLNEILVHYRLHQNNMSKDLIRTIEVVEKILLSWKDEIVFSKIIKKFYIKSFYELARSNQNYKNEIVKFKDKASVYWYHPKFLKALVRYNKKYKIK